MQIIVIGKHGDFRGMTVSKYLGYFFATVLITLVAGLVVLGVRVSKHEAVDSAVIENWQGTITEHRSELDGLQQQALAKNDALTNQLSKMQGRLWRIEALAAHMRDLSGLQDDEFNFEQTVAQGGPLAEEAREFAWVDLQTQLNQLALQLDRREKELGILDTVMVELQRSEQVQLSGRPIAKGWLSSAYGNRMDPITGQPAWHAGVDFAGSQGSDVLAVASGVVVFADRRDGYGKLVEINHGNGVSTRYGHHDKLLVKAGEIVKKGDVIGLMGSSGRSTGPHVHFEVLRNGRNIDPTRFISGNASGG
ncbi:MAG: peptidoglycan DD-metalloendopeptidase family protein [Candidatus Azotimanducaceae bacterium]